MQSQVRGERDNSEGRGESDQVAIPLTYESLPPAGPSPERPDRPWAWAFLISGGQALACMPAVLVFEHFGWEDAPLHLTSFCACIICTASAVQYMRMCPTRRVIWALAWIALVLTTTFFALIATLLFLLVRQGLMVCYAVRVTAVGGARCRCGCKKSGDIPGCGTGKMIVPRMEAEAASGLPPVTLQGGKRGILLVLLILNGILLPIGCVPALLVVNAVNPMAMAFVTDIHVINGLEEPIAITPIGTVGPDGKRSPLPMYASRFPVIPSDRSGGFVVDPGETVELLYDWDDINLSELVITFADGTTRQLVVDPQPTINQYRKPATNQFMISSPSRLEPVPPDVAAAGERAQRPTHLWLKVLPLFLPWITFYLLLKSYRRRRGGESDAGAAI